MTERAQTRIHIDCKSGFCFGVEKAIQKAEEMLAHKEQFFCLGNLVHNDLEMERLRNKGLTVISHKDFFKLQNQTVLLRTHGEPPEVYRYANANHIRLIDATCPVVLQLQQKVLRAHESERRRNGQLLIFGKKDHAEVIGLNGQTNNQATIIEDEKDIAKIDFSKPASLFSQTTKSLKKYQQLGELISRKISRPMEIFNTVCRQVDSRVSQLQQFAREHETIVFVGGTQSSNAHYLFDVCRKINSESFLVSCSNELPLERLRQSGSIGICGATSTPRWLMEEIADFIVKN